MSPSAHIADGSRIYRTYFINSRGDEQMGSTWNYLDITPLGRQEAWEDSPKGYPEKGCPGCSFVADQVAHLAHLNARDTTLVFVSRAPQAEIARLKERMGWDIPWYTLTDGFDADFDVDEWHGTNAFLRDGGEIFRTYFVDKRGDEQMGSTWNYLDVTALGRQEIWEDSPEGYPQTDPYQWWNRHDEYK